MPVQTSNTKALRPKNAQTISAAEAAKVLVDGLLNERARLTDLGKLDCLKSNRPLVELQQRVSHFLSRALQDIASAYIASANKRRERETKLHGKELTDVIREFLRLSPRSGGGATNDDLLAFLNQGLTPKEESSILLSGKFDECYDVMAGLLFGYQMGQMQACLAWELYLCDAEKLTLEKEFRHQAAILARSSGTQSRLDEAKEIWNSDFAEFGKKGHATAAVVKQLKTASNETACTARTVDKWRAADWDAKTYSDQERKRRKVTG